MELVPCNVCRRHVSVGEATCPFCAAAVPVQRARRFAPGGRITRAAVFSAALVGCESKPEESPTAAPAPQHEGSDDLEQLLDGDRHVVDRPAPRADAAVAFVPADATAIAASAIDAGVRADAGVDQRALAAKREKQQRDKREREQRERQERERIERLLDDQTVRNPDWQINAKPYGAPPARRRVV